MVFLEMVKHDGHLMVKLKMDSRTKMKMKSDTKGKKKNWKEKSQNKHSPKL